MYKSVFVNDIHNQLMTSVNPEISCIRMGSGPALFGLARFYCIAIVRRELHGSSDAVINELFASNVFNNNFNHGQSFTHS